MYAVVKTGGKQYRVAEGDVIKVEKLEGTPGESVALDQVLLVKSGDDVLVGQPLVAGAKVAAKIVDQDRHRKVLVFKFKRRKRYRRKNGHRQAYTELEITGIEAGRADAVGAIGATPAGDTLAGDTLAGDTLAGDTLAGDTLAGAGDTPAGDTPAGAGDTPAGDTLAGDDSSAGNVVVDTLADTPAGGE